MLALILIAPRTRELILAILLSPPRIGVTLAAAALVSNVPPPPIEATIAYRSLLWPPRSSAPARARLVWRRGAPWVVAFTFGLLHGFGFAGALSEVASPPVTSRSRSFLQCRRRSRSASGSLSRTRHSRPFSARAAPTAPLGCSRTALYWHARHVLGNSTRVSVLNKCSGGDIT